MRIHVVPGDASGRKFPVRQARVELQVEQTESAVRILPAVTPDQVAPDRLSKGRLRQAYERMRALDESRRMLLNTVAHELSSPSTVAYLQLDLLKAGRMGPMTPDQKHAVDLAHRSLESLSALLTDLLDVARYQNDRLPILPTYFDFDGVLREIEEAALPEAKMNGVGLTVGHSDGFWMEADRGRVLQVLRNLVGNALKFTPKGGRVWVDVAQRGGWIEVSVRDTGIGIRGDDMSRLFQPFSRIPNAGGHSPKGTGLGLYISLAIVEQHGGRMWADSEGRGHGSSFSFSLPQYAFAARDGSATGRNASVRPLGFWPLVYFACPTCGTRDIDMKLLRNKYECNGCGFTWR